MGRRERLAKEANKALEEESILVYKYVCIYIYTYIHTYMHTHTVPNLLQDTLALTTAALHALQIDRCRTSLSEGWQQLHAVLLRRGLLPSSLPSSLSASHSAPPHSSSPLHVEREIVRALGRAPHLSTLRQVGSIKARTASAAECSGVYTHACVTNRWDGG